MLHSLSIIECTVRRSLIVCSGIGVLHSLSITECAVGISLFRDWYMCCILCLSLSALFCLFKCMRFRFKQAFHTMAIVSNHTMNGPLVSCPFYMYYGNGNVRAWSIKDGYSP